MPLSAQICSALLVKFKYAKDSFAEVVVQINGISIIRAGHRQAVDLIRGAIGVLRITATSVITNIGKKL